MSRTSNNKKIEHIIYVLQKEGKYISKTEKRKLEQELFLLQEKANPNTCGDAVVVQMSCSSGSNKGYIENKKKQIEQNEKRKREQMNIDLENERKMREELETKKMKEEEENKKKNELEALKSNIKGLLNEIDEDEEW